MKNIKEIIKDINKLIAFEEKPFDRSLYGYFDDEVFKVKKDILPEIDESLSIEEKTEVLKKLIELEYTFQAYKTVKKWDRETIIENDDSNLREIYDSYKFALSDKQEQKDFKILLSNLDEKIQSLSSSLNIDVSTIDTSDFKTIPMKGKKNEKDKTIYNGYDITKEDDRMSYVDPIYNEKWDTKAIDKIVKLGLSGKGVEIDVKLHYFSDFLENLLDNPKISENSINHLTDKYMNDMQVVFSTSSKTPSKDLEIITDKLIDIINKGEKYPNDFQTELTVDLSMAALSKNPSTSQESLSKIASIVPKLTNQYWTPKNLANNNNTPLDSLKELQEQNRVYYTDISKSLKKSIETKSDIEKITIKDINDLDVKKATLDSSESTEELSSKIKKLTNGGLGNLGGKNIGNTVGNTTKSKSGGSVCPHCGYGGNCMC